ARPGRVRRRLAVWGAISVVAAVGCWSSQRGGGIDAWQAAVGPISFLVVAIAALFLNAALAPLLLEAIARLAARTRRAPVLLALANLVRDPRRAGVMAVAVAAPMIVGFASDGFVTSARRGIVESFADSEPGVSVSTVGVNEGDDAFLGPPALAALAALPGVAEVHQGVFVAAGHTIGDLIGVSAYQGADISDVRTLEGPADQRRFEAGEVLIGPGLARRSGAREGDTVTVPTPAGTVTLTVLAVVEDGDFGGFNVTTTYDRLVALYGPQAPAFVVLSPAAGVTEAELAATVLAAKDGIDPRLDAITTDELVADIVESIDSQMLPFRVMQQGLTFVAFVAVLSTLLLAGLQRRREHGLLAAVGATPPELARVVLAEAGAVGLVASLSSIVFGPLVLWTMLQVIPVLIGVRNPFQADWAGLVVTAFTASVIALAAASWPAWRAGRVDVLDALRYE
ncbi:MAG: FtsX-like permease family protein, partial [Actinomycetota bacterium]|nr:FtsX-like permease family protein [Actinomycetota bacterium]